MCTCMPSGHRDVCVCVCVCVSVRAYHRGVCVCECVCVRMCIAWSGAELWTAGFYCSECSDSGKGGGEREREREREREMERERERDYLDKVMGHQDESGQ